MNSMLPIAAAARLGLPLVDADGMGRAFPELQMVTFTMGGVSATPMALVDEKGNSAILTPSPTSGLRSWPGGDHELRRFRFRVPLLHGRRDHEAVRG